jgi:hypothetical protein
MDVLPLPVSKYGRGPVRPISSSNRAVISIQMGPSSDPNNSSGSMDQKPPNQRIEQFDPPPFSFATTMPVPDPSGAAPDPAGVVRAHDGARLRRPGRHARVINVSGPSAGTLPCGATTPGRSGRSGYSSPRAIVVSSFFVVQSSGRRWRSSIYKPAT